jgi:UDPglucose 6-dehydrogenase/GDP-mannose 6-dehydrogenase
MQVTIVGAGYVGLVTGLCLADQGHHIKCIDVDVSKLERLNRGLLPIHEPGLGELLQKHLGTRFFPTADLAGAVRSSDLTMITVGTPVENGGINLRFVASAARSIGEALAGGSRYHVVVVKSTVVPGTTDDLVRRLVEKASGLKCGPDFGVGMNPEFLREGEGSTTSSIPIASSSARTTRARTTPSPRSMPGSPTPRSSTPTRVPRR